MISPRSEWQARQRTGTPTRLHSDLATIPATGTTAQILTLLRSIDARLARLEADDDQRAARVAALRKP